MSHWSARNSTHSAGTSNGSFRFGLPTASRETARSSATAEFADTALLNEARDAPTELVDEHGTNDVGWRTYIHIRCAKPPDVVGTAQCVNGGGSAAYVYIRLIPRTCWLPTSTTGQTIESRVSTRKRGT